MLILGTLPFPLGAYDSRLPVIHQQIGQCLGYVPGLALMELPL